MGPSDRTFQRMPIICRFLSYEIIDAFHRPPLDWGIILRLGVGKIDKGSRFDVGIYRASPRHYTDGGSSRDLA